MSIFLNDETHSYGEIQKIGRGEIHVGKYCSISNGVYALFVSHNIDWISTYPFTARQIRRRWNKFCPPDIAEKHPKQLGDIHIQNDVYVGWGSVLKGGITLYDGSVIASNSVVVTDVPAYRVYAGNPAKEVSRRFTALQAMILLGIKWWDWPDEKVQENLELLNSDNIDEFIKQHRRE